MEEIASTSLAETSTPNLAESNAQSTRELFGADYHSISSPDDLAHQAKVATRIYQEYAAVSELPAALEAKMQAATASRKRRKVAEDGQPSDPKLRQMIEGVSEKAAAQQNSQALTVRARGSGAAPNANGPTPQRNLPSSALVRKDTIKQVKPEWHAPWKVFRVISGHMGWVRSVAMDPDNKFFVTGAADRTIKLWDLASGTLKLTLTGHISAVRGLAISARHPYLFSCGEDKTVKCWDLETNKVIRHYHGHLSGVYTLDLHPTLDILATGGRDASVRIWDMRTRSNIHVLSGHKGTCAAVKCQEADPQIISGSLDSTIRMYDLAAGKTMGVLTHHKKGVRALATHPKEFTFASGSSQTIKQWKCPEGAFMQNFEGHNAIINTLSVNEDNVLFSGGDDGTTAFFDWKTGHKFQSVNSVAQPGSLDAEAGVMCSTFDLTGLRLITGESDKTIKIWKQDESATEETNPLDWKPTLGRQKF